MEKTAIQNMLTSKHIHFLGYHNQNYIKRSSGSTTPDVPDERIN